MTGSTIRLYGETIQGGRTMRRIILVLLALPLLCGCAQITQFYCATLASDSMAVVVDATGQPVGLIEKHGGMMCLYPPPPASVQGQIGGCILMGSWEQGEWLAARRALGVPENICVYCEDGHKECPDSKVIGNLSQPEVDSNAWGSIKAMYR